MNTHSVAGIYCSTQQNQLKITADMWKSALW